MNWEPIAIYKLSNGENKVIFQKNVDGAFLITDHATRKTKCTTTIPARKIWKEYQEKGYTKI